MSSIELGGNIELSGFKDVDGGSMIIIKKVVGNYVRKMNDMSSKFEKLSLNMKVIHEKEKGEKYEVHAKLMDNGKIITSEMTERNLFFTIDKALSKIVSEIAKE